MPEKTVSITRSDRKALLRLLAELHTQMGYVIASNTPATSDDEDTDLADAEKIQAEAVELAKRLRRAK